MIEAARKQPLAACAAGSILLLVALVFGVRSARLALGAVRVQGEVVQLKTWESGESSLLPVVRFEDENGLSRTVTADVGDDMGMSQIGERIEVLYPRGHPERARVGGFENLWSVPVILGGFGAVLLGLGLHGYRHRRGSR